MSFWIYPIVFSLSCGLLRLSEKIEKRQRIIIVIFALLLPSIISGCRDYSMGYDVEHYGNRYFELAKQYNLFDYMKWMTERQIEPLYALLNKVVSYVTVSPHVLYGTQTFMILFLIYLVVKENGYPIDVCLMAFFCFMFVDSFNILRQYIATAIVFYSYIFIKRKKIVKYIICIAIAMGFHFMAVTGFVLWPIYYGIAKFDDSVTKDTLKNSKKVKRKIIILSLVAVGLVLSFSNISGILVRTGILPARYIAYGTDLSTSINITGTLSRLPLFVLAYIAYKCRKKNDSEFYFLLTLLILEIVLIQLRTLGSVFFRISFVFTFFKILLIGHLCNRYPHRKKNIYKLRMFHLLTCAYTIFYFVLVYFVVRNEGYYSSAILGIG